MSYSVVTTPVINVTVTSSLTSLASEKRFAKDLTIAALKAKLELVTGAVCTNQIIEVYSKDDSFVCRLDNDNALLGSYPVDDNMRLHAFKLVSRPSKALSPDCKAVGVVSSAISKRLVPANEGLVHQIVAPLEQHVIDRGGKTADFEDVSQVQKFEISEDEYAKRTDSVRAFKERMKIGQFKDVDPEERKRKEEEKQRLEKEEEDKANAIAVGNRCEVRVSGQPPKRGTVLFVGLTDFKPGYWVGVKYDEPVGKHDGSVQGRRYFECPDKYGAFAKPQTVEVGDFPELSIDDELMEL